jgi:hypothetical protein
MSAKTSVFLERALLLIEVELRTARCVYRVGNSSQAKRFYALGQYHPLWPSKFRAVLRSGFKRQLEHQASEPTAAPGRR